MSNAENKRNEEECEATKRRIELLHIEAKTWHHAANAMVLKGPPHADRRWFKEYFRRMASNVEERIGAIKGIEQ